MINKPHITLILMLIYIALGDCYAQFKGGTGRGDVMTEGTALRIGNYWTGSEDNIWGNSNNWRLSYVPTTTRAVIPVVTTFPSINSNISEVVTKLRIEVGATITIQPSGMLSVTELLENKSDATGLIISSDATGTGSLLHTSDEVLATAKRYIGGDKSAWHFLASPVTDEVVTDSEFTPAGTHGDGTAYDLYTWQEETSCWIYNKYAAVWDVIHPNDAFISGRGYLYSTEEVIPTYRFKGSLGNGIVTAAVTTNGATEPENHQGFNLLGNPYPSSIDWKESDGFVRDMLTVNGGGYDIWIWSPTAENYGVFNSASASDEGTNNISRYIAPMQAFFVQAATAGDFLFYNEARTHIEAGRWLRSYQMLTETPQIKIRVKSENHGSDEAVCSFDVFNDRQGASKLFSPIQTAPSLYFESKAKQFSTFHLADSIGCRSIPFAFKAGIKETYTLNIEADADAIKSLILEDKYTNQKIKLSPETEYQFNASQTEATNRFVLHINRTINTLYNSSDYNFQVNNKVLNIVNLNPGIQSTIRITALTGQLIHQASGNLTSYNYQLPQKGIYIITIKTNKEVISTKIIN